MSETLIVDTDILIDAGRSLAEAVSFLEEAERDSDLAISAISKMELMIGCRNKTEMRTMEQFIERFSLMQINETITGIAIDLLRHYRLSHGLLIPDALIAATAISANVAFATRNQKDFRFITDLNLLTYP